jgi:FAD/FMN-containing dehydrogenase
MRMMPSTFATATIGGFIAGGSGGIGSCTGAALRDLGNIIRLRVVTMEEEPRVLDLPARNCPASPTPIGTNGIITEIEMPLAPAYDWVELLSPSTISWPRNLRQELANEDGILIKLATVYRGAHRQELTSSA